MLAILRSWGLPALALTLVAPVALAAPESNVKLVSTDIVRLGLFTTPAQGDHLILCFDGPVTAHHLGVEHLTLTPAGDSLGRYAVIAQPEAGNHLIVVLGQDAKLTVEGQASAINLSATLPAGALLDDAGLSITASATAVDVADHPTLLSATFEDRNDDLIPSKGDFLRLFFDRAVKTSRAIPGWDFELPVAGDAFGAGATFQQNLRASQRLTMVLGSGPSFTLEGVFSKDAVTKGSPSGIRLDAGIKDWVITDDVDGLSARSHGAVDVEFLAMPAQVADPRVLTVVRTGHRFANTVVEITAADILAQTQVHPGTVDIATAVDLALTSFVSDDWEISGLLGNEIAYIEDQTNDGPEAVLLEAYENVRDKIEDGTLSLVKTGDADATAPGGETPATHWMFRLKVKGYTTVYYATVSRSDRSDTGNFGID